jgi:hypothetical protein
MRKKFKEIGINESFTIQGVKYYKVNETGAVPLDTGYIITFDNDIVVFTGEDE